MSWNLTNMSTYVKWAGLDPPIIRDFGYANGWREPPREVKRCQDLGHKLEGRQIYACVIEHYCPICKIQYKIDSSG